MEIHKVLVLSTGHLPENEFEYFNEKLTKRPIAELPFRVLEHEYGIITVLDFPDTDQSITTSVMGANYPAFSKLYEYAKANGIVYIDFDQDGPQEQEFEFFDW